MNKILNFLKVYYFIGMVIIGCNQPSSVYYNIMSIDGAKVVDLKLLNGDIVSISLSKEGDVKSFSNKITEDKFQVLTFHKNKFLDSKEMFDEDGNLFRRFYRFDDREGMLLEDLNYSNGNLFGSGLRYHDGSKRVKDILLFNKDGELVYQKSFDLDRRVVYEFGNPIYE